MPHKVAQHSHIGEADLGRKTSTAAETILVTFKTARLSTVSVFLAKTACYYSQMTSDRDCDNANEKNTENST